MLEHLPDDAAAMAELARVLRPGGTLAVSVPRYGPEVVNWALSDRYHRVPGGHVRIYRRRQLLERLGERRPGAGRAPTTRTRCTARTGGCGASSGPRTTSIPPCAPTTASWSGTSPPARPFTRVPERMLNPLLGKSLVVYLRHARR